MNDTESRNLGPGSPGPISRPSSKVGVVRCYSRPEGETNVLPAPVAISVQPAPVAISVHPVPIDI